MNSIPLNPVPGFRPDPSRNPLADDLGGFVDEAVVSALIPAPRVLRSQPRPADLVLSSTDDYAGWPAAALPQPMFRGAVAPASTPRFKPVRRASPPQVARDEISVTLRQRPRWWLAGIATALATLTLVALLLTLAGYSIDPILSFTQGTSDAAASELSAEADLQISADSTPVARLTP